MSMDPRNTRVCALTMIRKSVHRLTTSVWKQEWRHKAHFAAECLWLVPYGQPQSSLMCLKLEWPEIANQASATAECSVPAVSEQAHGVGAAATSDGAHDPSDGDHSQQVAMC